jgi:hypothetical protein
MKKTIRLLALAALLAAVAQGCGGRVCSSHMTDGSHSQPCERECLSRTKYYKCECEQRCPCWSSAHP